MPRLPDLPAAQRQHGPDVAFVPSRLRVVALAALAAAVAATAACSRPGDTGGAALPAGAAGSADSALAVSALVTDPAAPRTMEGLSLLGDTLWRPSFPDSVRAALERNLAAAEAGVAAAPGNPDSLIWLGRRQAYLGRYQAAIATFTRGIAAHPADARFLRHRGHRFLSVREIDPAIADFTKAAELEQGRPDAIEPDGAPNAANIPLSTTQFNIWYHLGLAHFLRGDWEAALEAYDACLAVSKNPDLRVATAYWRYLTLRRMGREADAERSVAFAGDSVTLLENDGYLELIRLYRGDLSVDDVMPPMPTGGMDVANSTTAFGVSMWHLLEGRPEQARSLWERIVAGGQWAAFGSLAAEAELARGRRK